MDIKELREKFFAECTRDDLPGSTVKVVDLAPHNVFEWFRPYLIQEKENYRPLSQVSDQECYEIGLPYFNLDKVSKEDVIEMGRHIVSFYEAGHYFTNNPLGIYQYLESRGYKMPVIK